MTNKKGSAKPCSPEKSCALGAYRAGKAEAYAEAARIIDSSSLTPVYDAVKLAQEFRAKAFDNSRPLG